MSSKKKLSSIWTIVIAIVLAIIAGRLTGTTAGVFNVTFYSIYDLVGKLFLNALTLVVVPLIASSIITGIAKIGNEESLGRLGAKTFGFYIGTSLLAVLIGLFFVNLFHPGSIIAENPAYHLEAQNLQANINLQESKNLSQFLLQIVPSNIVDVFSQGHMMELIFFSLLFGYAMAKVGTAASALLAFWQGLFDTMIRMTQLVMKCLPLGVFALVAKTFSTTGVGSLESVALFGLSVVLGLATFVFVALPLLLKFIAKVSPLRHFQAMAPALITAFSTSSSSATLPITIDCVEKRAGVSNRICSLVIPLGTSINMSGSALYECVAAIFVAQAYGIDLSFTSQFLIVFLALITSMGVAGIPSASLVALVVILKAMGLPLEGIGLFVAIDRILDMCRTTVNVFSDSCCAILVARTEGEKNVLQKEPL